jgi:hypothetical protein
MGSPKPLLWNLLFVTVLRVKSPRLAMQTPLLKFWRKSLPSQVTSSTRPEFSMLMPLPSRQGLYTVISASIGAVANQPMPRYCPRLPLMTLLTNWTPRTSVTRLVM